MELLGMFNALELIKNAKEIPAIFDFIPITLTKRDEDINTFVFSEVLI